MTTLNFYLKRNPITGSPSLERTESEMALEESRFGVGGGNLPDSERKLVFFIRFKPPCDSGA
jgi:hypothetical protein